MCGVCGKARKDHPNRQWCRKQKETSDTCSPNPAAKGKAKAKAKAKGGKAKGAPSVKAAEALPGAEALGDAASQALLAAATSRVKSELVIPALRRPPARADGSVDIYVRLCTVGAVHRCAIYRCATVSLLFSGCIYRSIAVLYIAVYRCAVYRCIAVLAVSLCCISLYRSLALLLYCMCDAAIGSGCLDLLSSFMPKKQRPNPIRIHEHLCFACMCCFNLHHP